MRIDEIQFTGKLTRIHDSDFWTDATQHQIDIWDGFGEQFLREKLREYGHFVMRMTSPDQLSERLGPLVDITTPTQSLTFNKSFEI